MASVEIEVGPESQRDLDRDFASSVLSNSQWSFDSAARFLMDATDETDPQLRKAATRIQEQARKDIVFITTWMAQRFSSSPKK